MEGQTQNTDQFLRTLTSFTAQLSERVLENPDILSLILAYLGLEDVIAMNKVNKEINGIVK